MHPHGGCQPPEGAEGTQDLSVADGPHVATVLLGVVLPWTRWGTQALCLVAAALMLVFVPQDLSVLPPSRGAKKNIQQWIRKYFLTSRES